MDNLNDYPLYCFFFNSAFNMRITLDEIIRRHRENNPYSDCIYTKTVLGKTLHDKVIITCKKHGDFLQAPHEHMKGQGCPICGKEQMKDTKTTDINILIQKSKDMFKEKFSYEETIKTYKNVKTKCKPTPRTCTVYTPFSSGRMTASTFLSSVLLKSSGSTNAALDGS